MVDNKVDYWRGVYDAYQYMLDELGIEDAMDAKMAIWAVEELEKAGELV